MKNVISTLEEDHKNQISKLINQEHKIQAMECAAAVLKAQEQFEDEKRVIEREHRDQLHICEQRIGLLENEVEAGKDIIYNMEVTKI